MDFAIFDKKEVEEMFRLTYERMPEKMRKIAVDEFGGVDEWKKHFMEVVSSEDMQKKYRIVKRGVEQQTELIDKYRLNVVFGTDMATNKYFCEEHQLKDFGTWGQRYGSFKTLQAATGRAHDLLKLSTYRNPYPEGKIGVLEKGSFADLLIVDGNPVKQVDLLTDKNNIRVIMKDGIVYKNTIIS